MLQELGLPSRSLDEIGRFVGEGMAVLVERCLTFAAPPDAALLARGIAAFRHHYALTNGTLTRCYPGCGRSPAGLAGHRHCDGRSHQQTGSVHPAVAGELALTPFPGSRRRRRPRSANHIPPRCYMPAP